MKKLILLTCVMSLLFVTAKSQSLLNSKINKAKDAVTNGGTSVKGTLNSADSLKKQGQQIGGMLGIKGKVALTIKVPGASRAKIKELWAAVKSCPGVGEKNAEYNWDENDQSITVKYKDPISKLLDAIEKATPTVTDANATVSSDGTTITVKL
ncbi:MAG: hypothetical protein ACHQHN_00330 [Sphingobacteriales bacterium]